jgi:CubicO group peptidase (beta-lactamase class C family)
MSQSSIARRTFMGTALAGFGGLAYAKELDWPDAGAAAAPFDMARLNAVRDRLEQQRTKAFLVLHRGRKVMEWYAPGTDFKTRHGTASMAKALVGGTSLLVAISDGRLSPFDRAVKYIPAWANDAKKSKITIRQLASHTSGIEDSSVSGIAHGKEPAWKGQFWRREPDPFSVSVQSAPVIFEPGTGYQYSNPGMALLAYAVTASLRGTPQTDIRTLLRDRVFRELGIPDEAWSIGYGKPYQVDGLDLYANWGGGTFTARATARIGEWMMHLGKWEGKQLIREAVARQAVAYSGLPLPARTPEDKYGPGSGLCWYTNFDSVWPEVPRDAFAGAGAQHQVILVVPSLELVVVRNGGALADKVAFWTAVYENLFEPVMKAIGSPARVPPPQYPRSAAIRNITFGTEVKRQAIESDNWPLTWADDDAIYTSYGDGFGFEPAVKEKLSMGFARVDGGPRDFRGQNIRSASGERTGDGKAGAKASGMLAVDGVLYMWVRNTGNAQLVWSDDHARTWNWGFKLDQSFGSPAFVNYGRNYAGAKDDYVYTYSQDGPSAYDISDGVVLARAKRGQMRDRARWEFFNGTADKPAWTRNVAQRKQVFEYRGHCQRVEAVYHPALGRYLLIVGYGHNGGWGIYDAPKPWGPWTVAFHTEYWGLGGTHGYRIPTKWISADGHSAALVFSGLIHNGTSYDAFCVREMRFEF